ncbi:AraC family transcriptional regulator [Oceanirhabdus sp. W0125-5]|uniref:AraC family transcriptional regulator n=1 Tax=Oceanirhabdus sp. W0125-5 TaxID=2999116 RepID=UPI0022F2ACBB|nr:AraC family transcriptional regulator [Oceanirhabdus sp. W0125-5]WBW97678.1 AraC family transcriptional regulator [Oceanirhabdus sp. W0125-5]
MNIRENQEIKFENLLSFRGKMTQQELTNEMMKIGQVLKDLGVKKNGPIISTTFSVELIDGQQVMDSEFLIPLDKEVELPKEYSFKKVFHLVNALCIRHNGNPNLIQNTYNQLNTFIQENRLQPITSGYNIPVNEVTDPSKLDEVIIDVYIGVNPCII